MSDIKRADGETVKNLSKMFPVLLVTGLRQVVSLITSSIVQYAVIWELTVRTKSAAVLSMASLVGFLPMALFRPFIGGIEWRNIRWHDYGCAVFTSCRLCFSSTLSAGCYAASRPVETFDKVQRLYLFISIAVFDYKPGDCSSTLSNSSAALAFVTGLAAPFFSSVMMSLIQGKIEAKYLGRVLGITTSIMSVACPIGLSFSSLFADSVGVNLWVTISGILTLICVVLCRFIKCVWSVDSSK